MASPISAAQSSGRLMVNIFDGTRRLMPAGTSVLITVRDGNQNVISRDFHTQPSVMFSVPIFNNFGDQYAVIASANGYRQVGFTPVKAALNVVQSVDLMLLPSDGAYNFAQARWDRLQQARPELFRVLSHGVSDDAAQNRYTDLLENRPPSLACALNLAAAMEQILLPQRNVLQYFKEIIWDSLAPDRFFGFVDPALVDQVVLATAQGLFTPEHDPAILHPGATRSFKQVQFGEANVQLTFHENPADRKEIDGVSCVLVEPDMDYYRDPLAHTLLEVVPNRVTGGITDPRTVYVLRWMAGRRAGVPEFDPLYTIE